MGDPTAGARAAEDLLEHDEALQNRILLYGYSLTGNAAEAEDLARQGTLKVIDPKGSPWDPEKEPNLFLHVGSVMNSLAANKRRGDRRHPTVDHDVDLEADPQPSADEQLIEAEEVAQMRRQMAELRQRLAGDRLALGKIDLVYEGIDDASDQAARLGCTLKDVYRTNERIAYHANQLKRELEREERARVLSRAAGRVVDPEPREPSEAES